METNLKPKIQIREPEGLVGP